MRLGPLARGQVATACNQVVVAVTVTARALDQAGRSGITLPLTAGLLRTVTNLIATGLGDLDSAVVHARIEPRPEAGR